MRAGFALRFEIGDWKAAVRLLERFYQAGLKGFEPVTFGFVAARFAGRGGSQRDKSPHVCGVGGRPQSPVVVGVAVTLAVSGYWRNFSGRVSP